MCHNVTFVYYNVSIVGSVIVRMYTVPVLGSCVAGGGAAAAEGVAAGAAGGVASCRSAAKEREKWALMACRRVVKTVNVTCRAPISYRLAK